ncbi:MAG: hypothetical protein M3N47_09810, partial [Chloroflexota bacterium]|nr:hypothetical protein [Chloroflexota bacterium]
LDGLWEVFIGAFLFRGATASHKRAVLRERLEGRRIADIMGSVPPALSPHSSLAEALAQVQQRPSLLWPVGDPVTGALLLEQIDAVPSEQWERTTVEQVAHSAAALTVDIDESLDTAVTRMAEAPQNMVIVVAQGRPVGLLTPSLVTGLHS